MKQTSAIFLALLILAMNASLTFNTHLCGGLAVKSTLTFGLEDLDCGMAESMDIELADRGANEMAPAPCCENLHSFFKTNEKYQGAGGHQILTIPAAVVLPISVLLSTIYHHSADHLDFQFLDPPNLKQRITVLYQVFRI